MKQALAILFMMALMVFKAQSEIFTITEEQAEFPGGTAAMMQFISKNIKYPETAEKCKIGGKSHLRFIVDIDGTTTNIEVLKSTGAAYLDSAAVNVVRAMPQWKPASQSGRKVRCYFNIPINFKVNEPYIVFSKNSNSFYGEAKQALIEKADIDGAISLLQKDVGDPDAWYVLGVLHYIKGNKKTAKDYFEQVKMNGPTGVAAYDMSVSFLEKYF